MAGEYFLVPMIEVQGPLGLTRRAKYSKDPAVTLSAAIRLGRTDDAILYMEATQTYLDSVAAESDATRLATTANLDSVLTAGQANAAKTKFEASFIPGEFINAGDTRREALRKVLGAFLFSQRMEGRFGESWKKRAQANGVTLNTEWRDFPVALQNEFRDIRDEKGWTNQELGLTGSSTLREIMGAVSDQWGDAPFELGNHSI